MTECYVIARIFCVMDEHVLETRLPVFNLRTAIQVWIIVHVLKMKTEGIEKHQHFRETDIYQSTNL